MSFNSGLPVVVWQVAQGFPASLAILGLAFTEPEKTQAIHTATAMMVTLFIDPSFVGLLNEIVATKSI